MWSRGLMLSWVFLIPPVTANSASVLPPTRYIDRGACPFECCTYRNWKTEKPVTLVDRPEGKKKVATVTKGQTVRGVTGEVISMPVPMVATSDLEGTPIKKGGRFYRLHYAGEGFWSIWYRGKVYSTELDAGPAPLNGSAPASDPSLWWVKVRTRGGVTGWTLEQGQFSNQDACG
jgi:hypothetical protein